MKFFILFLFFLFTAPLSYAETCIKNKRKLVSQLKQQVKKFDSEKTRSFLSPLIDISWIAEKSLGRHWKDVPSKDRDKFMFLLSALIHKNYLSNKEENKYMNEVSFNDVSVVLKNKTMTAHTELQKKSFESEVSLMFHENKLKCWKIKDTVIDDVSMVKNYHEQFNSIIINHGFKELISRMEKKVKST